MVRENNNNNNNNKEDIHFQKISRKIKAQSINMPHLLPKKGRKHVLQSMKNISNEKN